jgi:hypothetical protein
MGFMRRFVIHIDRLLLDGIDAREAARMVAQLHDEFERLVIAHPATAAGAAAGSQERVRCRIACGAGDAPHRALGTEVARILYGHTVGNHGNAGGER